MSDPNNALERDALIAEAKRIAESMGYDSVDIIVTRHNPDTRISSHGYGSYGNLFARIGVIRTVLTAIEKNLLESEGTDDT